MKDIQDDFSDLRLHWTSAEFNIFGWCCYAQATFNPGATILVGLEADDGSTQAPECKANFGTTGETNSLSFIEAPKHPAAREYPSILFAESNVGNPKNASCDGVASAPGVAL
jgi:hypothetical protein